MKRNLDNLAEKEFDVVVVGGGIFGIFAAWEATQRGLRVALIERDDFAGATSANSFKMVHGGIRYLQHGDLVRVRESYRERRALLRIAPHLVQPLPIVVPTYGRGKNGKALLRCGCFAYDLLTARRNLGIRDPSRQIPAATTVSRDECLKKFPGLNRDRLTGGVVFHDAQIYNPPRLALAVLRSAVEEGAVVANYVEAKRFLRRNGRVVGVQARDLLTGNVFEVRAKIVVNAAGPWVPLLLEKKCDLRIRPPLSFSRDASFVVPRRLTGDEALAVLGKTRDPEALIARSQRHLFLVPWRSHTLVGVWHVVYQGQPDGFNVTEEQLQSFLDEINESYTSLNLTLEDVSVCNAGLVLFGDNKPGASNLSYGHRSRIIDHEAEHGVDGLISVVGVRYTVARHVAETVVGLLASKLRKRLAASRTAVTPVFGGNIKDMGEFTRRHVTSRPSTLQTSVICGLVRNYGTDVGSVLSRLNENDEWANCIGDSSVIKAEVIHAVREEMACRLADVVFRRTDLATGAHPGEEALEACADLMASELGWNESRKQHELDQVRRVSGRQAIVVA